MVKRLVKKPVRDRIIGQIVAFLKVKGVPGWSIQDKGALVAAIKQQITEKA